MVNAQSRLPSYRMATRPLLCDFSYPLLLVPGYIFLTFFQMSLLCQWFIIVYHYRKLLRSPLMPPPHKHHTKSDFFNNKLISSCVRSVKSWDVNNKSSFIEWPVKVFHADCTSHSEVTFEAGPVIPGNRTLKFYMLGESLVAFDKTTAYVLEPAYPCNQHQCCSLMKTTSNFTLRMYKFKKVERIAASLQLLSIALIWQQPRWSYCHLLCSWLIIGIIN